MTENKLTLADCFKYYNSRLIEKDGFKFNNIAEFLGCKFDSLDNYQLELRSIEQLTDEEKEKIVKTYLEDNLEEWTNSDEVFSLILDTCSFEELVTFFDYLRKIGVDIDGLIEIGKAVKE